MEELRNSHCTFEDSMVGILETVDEENCLERANSSGSDQVYPFEIPSTYPNSSVILKNAEARKDQHLQPEKQLPIMPNPMIALWSSNFSSSHSSLSRRPSSFAEMNSIRPAFTQVRIGSVEKIEEIKQTIEQVAMRMVEHNELKLSSYKEQFGDFDKLLLSNILFILKKVHIDSSLQKSDFVEKANQVLAGNKSEKRKDDQLRFVYKRAIKVMLTKSTGYKPHSGEKMQEFEGKFMKHYFEGQDLVGEEVMDTSYASKKKLQKLFQSSPKFREDFIWSLKEIESDYSADRNKRYSSMVELLKEHEQKEQKDKHKILQKTCKRIPWSDIDLKKALEMVENLLKDCNAAN